MSRLYLRRLTTICSALLLVLGSAIAARAATVSYMMSYGPEGIPQSSHVVGVLPLFNPALGTLISVELTLDATTSAGTIDWENVAGVPSDVTLGIGASVNVQGQYGGLAATAVPLQLGAGSVSAYDGTTDYLGTSAFSVAGNAGFDSDTGGPLYDANYIGIGTFDVSGTSSVSTFLSTNGGFGPTQFTLGVTSGDVTVTYNYEAVPEPSTLAMLGVGLVSLAGLCRARRRNA